QELSELRAEVALALLTGERQAFTDRVKDRHLVSDYKQILSWCSAAFPAFFDCAPATIDDNAKTGEEPLKRFQAQYNQHKAELGAASQPDLLVDGRIGEKTWGALFDVYQFGIADELGEDAAGVAELRNKLIFVSDEHKTLGFGEHHPVDQAHRDS